MADNNIKSKKVSAVVPAFNEDRTIAGVVKALKASEFIYEVIVVDDGSKDRTAKFAKAAGARVVKMPKNSGKGQAISAGVKEAKSPSLIFVDADLENLTPAHIEKLIKPVLEGKVDMNIGLLDRGAFLNRINAFFEAPFSGTRALKRAVWESIPAKVFPARWEPERILKYTARKNNFKTKVTVLYNIKHYLKEQKFGFWQGFWRRLSMIGRIVLTVFWLIWLKLKLKP